MFPYLKYFNVKLRLALIISLYLCLAIMYSVIVPIGRGADEWAHYWYAQFIAQNRRLPLNPAEREIAGYKSDWPPLYHLAAAALTGWIETAGPPVFKYRPAALPGADNIRRQLVPAQGADAILHTEDELFPWQQEILVWHLGRFLSIGFTAGTLLVTYRLALEVFAESRGAEERGSGGAREILFPLISPISHPPSSTSRFTSPASLALVCVAFLAFIPRFLFTGMLFNYDSLTLLLASLFLWLAIRITKGHYSRWGFWALGGLAGLALLTKYLTALLPLEIVWLAFSRGAKDISPLLPRSSAPLLKLGQALLAFLLVTSGWFGYLLVNFNEIETYGPILGSIAPLLRGDGSDRTVEQLFAWGSGGQAPPPAHLDRQSYSVWQIVTELPLTFWGNPITRPYPLNWFVGIMTVVAVAAGVGLIMLWRHGATAPSLRRIIRLLLLHCLLPVPLMFIRLFGARDALEAVQGRHLLFLSGPAIVILLVLGWSYLTFQVSGFRFHAIRNTQYVFRLSSYIMIGLLLAGAIVQLIYMAQVYYPLLPVRTTPYPAIPANPLAAPIVLVGGAKLLNFQIVPTSGPDWFSGFFSASPSALKVSLFWQAGAEPAPEDYQTELALVNTTGETQAAWLAYQTQAHYPTRAWEAGDTIRDDSWLPLRGLAAGPYEIRWRILAETGEIMPWQILDTYTVNESTRVSNDALWRQGQVTRHPPTLLERETAQFTFTDPQPPAPDPFLIGPDGLLRSPASMSESWANFIIGPEWPAGDYRLQGERQPVLRVAKNERTFQFPTLTQPLAANFDGQVKLLGYDLSGRRVQPGDGLPITFYWQGLRWMGEDFVIFERLLDNQGRAWGGYDRRARENYSTLLWAPGEIVTDGFAVPIAPDAPNGVYVLSLGWYRRVNEAAQSLAILNPDTGQPTETTAVTIGPIKIGGPPPGITVPAAAPQTESNVTLGEQIKLLGFDLTGQSTSDKQPSNLPTFETKAPYGQPSTPLRLTLYWQALTAPTTDYTVFIHVRAATGDLAAQKDSPPAGGGYPTSLWDVGEIIKDEVIIPLEQVKPGRYELVVGLYDFTTGVRLPVTGSPDEAVGLGSFEVVE